MLGRSQPEVSRRFLGFVEGVFFKGLDNGAGGEEETSIATEIGKKLDNGVNDQKKTDHFLKNDKKCLFYFIARSAQANLSFTSDNSPKI